MASREKHDPPSRDQRPKKRRKSDTQLKQEMHTAAWNGKLKRVKQLVQDDPAAAHAPVTQNGGTPLYYAAYKNRLDVVRFLVCEAKADVNIATKDEGIAVVNLGRK